MENRLKSSDTNKQGQTPILASDWNKVARAVAELQGGVTVGPDAQGLEGILGIGLFHSDPWELSTTSGTFVKAVEGTVKFREKTAVFLVGHGHGQVSDGQYPLETALAVNGALVARRNNSDDQLPWGGGVYQPAASSLSTWTQVIAMGTATVDAGERKFELRFRSRPRDGVTRRVTLSGATLFALHLGTA
ncbi:hypothetical protein [Cryptosporangium sp. NPDC048952]|uniref:hypothetical protein n=1 Tax=Cryptosporangium sp. NPDC048952 TaxID=3363961 RepID=UPI00371F74FA